MNKFKTFLDNVGRSFNANRGDIMIGVGLGLIPVSLGAAIWGTYKAVPKIEQYREDNPDKPIGEAIVKAGCVYYVPMLSLTTLDLLLLYYGIKEGHKRETAMAAAYTISSTAFSEYRAKVREQLGEKAETEIRDTIAKDHMEAVQKPANNVYVASPDEILCFDELSGRYFYSKINKIEKAVNTLNRRMLTEMYISVNEFYYEIDQPGTRIGDLVGWNIDDGAIELQYSYCGNDDGDPCLVIGFTVAPNERFCHLA